MEDRIRKFMEYKGISPSELADSIGVQRSNVTHVLKSRNKPSFQFIEKMLQVYPELNAKWLLLGTGSMIETTVKNRTLFDQLTETKTVENHKEDKAETKLLPKESPVSASETNEIIVPPVTPPPTSTEKVSTDKVIQDQFFSQEKQIERLIVFFKDQTFKVYNPSL
jgi:transcriptional regulator with XRE-family HTH domain